MKMIKYMTLASIILFSVLYAQSFKENSMDCDAGSAEACYEAAKIQQEQAYKLKGSDVDKSAKAITNLYKKSCTLGYAKGCTEYAMNYASDTQKDPKKNPRFYFQKGCDGGDTTACTLLKMMPEGI